MKLKEYYEAKKLKELKNKTFIIKIAKKGEGRKYAKRQQNKRRTIKRTDDSES